MHDRQTWTASAALVAVLALAGCAQVPALVPAPTAQRVPGRELAAVAQNERVRLVVESGAWSAYPEDLARELTPLKVTIENHGQQPVRVRYEDIAIETGRGVPYSPLPPLQIKGRVTQIAPAPLALVTPRFAYSSFYVAPWYAPYYAGLDPWSYPFGPNRAYHRTYYARWSVELPTQDMIEQAVPEGVIGPGGSVSGFLYFPTIDERVERLSFNASFTNGKDGNGLGGVLSVPFVMR